jgi:hypothetical protein
MHRAVIVDLFTLFLTFFFAASAAAAETPALGIEFDRFEYGMIYFKGPDPVPPPLKTELQDVKYVGRLRPVSGDANPVPTFLFLAKEGEAEPAIHALRPPTKDAARQVASFVQPGKITDPRTGAVVLDSRGFVGHCLSRVRGDVYTVFQKERVDRRSRLQSSVFVAQSGLEHLDEKLVESRLPSINETLRLVKLKSCREVEARNRTMPLRPMSVVIKRELTPEDDEDQPDKNDEKPEAPKAEGAMEIRN